MNTDYKAIFDRLNERQRDVMGNLAIDNGDILEGAEGRANARTVKQLVRRGLLNHWTEDKTLPGWPPVRVTVPKYSMPLPVHMAWCEWCSEQIGKAQ